MQKTPLVHPTSKTTLNTTRELIEDREFCVRHRTKPKHFTRKRSLTFMNVVVMLLQKSVRSIQLRLHDFFETLSLEIPGVKAPSWCVARLKLRHTAFIELNERAILNVVYGPESEFKVRRWKSHRLVGIDSSLVRLPNREALGKEFGWVENSNHHGDCGRYPQARLSALTDVSNRIVVQTLFVPWQQGERALALQHLQVLEPQDLAILDRGYASYDLFAAFVAQDRKFVCRCARSSFGIVNELFKENRAGCSVEARLRPSASKRAAIRRAGLPEEITLRFVTVRLKTGELEVLATNLLDEAAYPTEEFGELYHQRWGIETYYGLIKGRLDLENFSGLSAEAIRQDLYSTIFLSNLESILIQPVREQLEKKSQPLKNGQQVNHAVSFHALKSQLIRLLLSSEPISKVVLKLQRLFLDNPVSNRPERVVPRKKKSAWASYHYQRNTRKAVF